MKREFKKLKMLALVFVFSTFFLMIWYVSNVVLAWVGPSANPLVQPIEFQNTCYSNFGERLVCEEGASPGCVSELGRKDCSNGSDCFSGKCQTGCPIFSNYLKCCVSNGAPCTTGNECCGGGCLGGVCGSMVCPV